MEGPSGRRAGTYQGYDAGARCVHPPLPHPRVAVGLPPHPPLWLPRQFSARTKHRTSPSLARRRAAAAPARRRYPSCRCDAEGIPAPVSVLRRTNVRHRSFRTRSFASIPRNGTSPGHQDRHLMISFFRPPARKVRRPFRRFSTDRGQTQTSTTTVCCVAAPVTHISPKQRRRKQPPCSSPTLQKAPFPACGARVPSRNALKSP